MRKQHGIDETFHQNSTNFARGPLEYPWIPVWKPLIDWYFPCASIQTCYMRPKMTRSSGSLSDFVDDSLHFKESRSYDVKPRWENSPRTATRQEVALIFLALESGPSVSNLGIWENGRIFHAEVHHVDKPKIKIVALMQIHVFGF